MASCQALKVNIVVFPRVQIRDDKGQVQRELDDALERLEKQSGGSQAAEDELIAIRKQLRQGEVRADWGVGCSCRELWLPSFAKLLAAG